MSDILERYERDLRKSLLADFGLVALDGPPAAAGRIVCQVIYKPSFHPEVCIHVERRNRQLGVSWSTDFRCATSCDRVYVTHYQRSWNLPGSSATGSLLRWGDYHGWLG